MSHAITPKAPLGRIDAERVLAVVVVFSVAFLARLLPTLRGGGLGGLHFYDDGVHFAAAVGLVHGRLPYRDFLLLHPPGIVLLLSPFAALTAWVSDARAFALARLAFIALGAVNALLVSRYLRSVGAFAAWFGGLFYALFWPAIYSEHTVLLEGPANTCLVVALLLLAPRRREVAPRTVGLLVAGGAVGFAMTIKIWGVVVVLVLLGWVAYRWRWRAAGLFTLGVAAVTTAVCLPFFAAAPATMWRMVVLDQVQRNQMKVPAIERFNEILGLTLYRPPEHWTWPVALACLLLLAAAVAAWTYVHTRPVVLLLVALVALLFSTPSWFVHYTAVTATTVALVVGAAGQRLVAASFLRRAVGVRIGVAAVVVASVVALAAPVATASIGEPFPGRKLGAAAAKRAGCVTSDHPSALILMSVLSRNLDRGCPLVVDLGGASYHLPSPDRGRVARRRNKVFQAYALAYLATGNTMILARFYTGVGFSKRTTRTLYRWPVVARAGRWALRAPRP